MHEIKLNIIEFITRLNLVPGGLSLGHRAFLKSFYGLELDEAEFEFYCRATGRKTYLPREHNEMTGIVGRRGGKTKLAALIAVYEAFREHRLPPGERAFILVIAPVVRQAQIAFNYIKTFVHRSPTLRQFIVRVRKDEIELRNGITIACYPCSYITVRGVSIVCAICDELAFWHHEETFANPEEEVIAALRPAMSTFPNAKLIKISTPYCKNGILWRDYQERGELDHLVWQASSLEMNPTISIDFLQKERQRGEEYFKREFLAEFTDSVAGWITPEILDPCVMRGHRELPRVSNGTYVAVADPAFRSSDFGFAVLHRSNDGNITAVHVASWRGTKKVPLDLERVCAEINEILQRYGINTLVGDQFCFPIIKQHFEKLGIFYQEFTFGTHTRASIYGNLRQLISQQKITLVDEPELLRQLRSLEELKAPNGNVDVRPPRSQNDDIAIAVALGAFKLSESGESFPLKISFGRASRPWDGLLPTRGGEERGGFPVGPEVCGKFPKCWDDGHCECYGF